MRQALSKACRDGSFRFQCAMFGFGDARITKELADGTFQLVALLDAAGIGQPPRFWRDPYVLGFLFGTASVLGAISSGNKLHGERGGKIVVNALQIIAGPREQQAREAIISLMQARDETFLRAAAVAGQLVDFAYGNPVRGHGIDIGLANQQGEKLELALEGHNDPSIVRKYAYGVLAEAHWIDVIRDRFGLITDSR